MCGEKTDIAKSNPCLLAREHKLVVDGIGPEYRNLTKSTMRVFGQFRGSSLTFKRSLISGPGLSSLSPRPVRWLLAKRLYFASTGLPSPSVEDRILKDSGS